MMRPARRPAGSPVAGHLDNGQDGSQPARMRGWIPGPISRMARQRCERRRAPRAILAAIAIAGVLLPALPPEAAAATGARAAFKRVPYRGYSFKVPHSWRVIRLGGKARTCVRFDRHTIYLGTPSPNEACPSSLIGTTEAMLVGPARPHAARVSVESKVSRRITVSAPRIHITATFGTHRGVIRRILASAGLPQPVEDPPAAASRRWLPAGVTNYRGRGFDTCTAPSRGAMGAWRAHSPYRAVGIYLGGSDAACAQPNLTPSWLRYEAARGWRFIPMYVGPQAAFGELRRSPGRQATAAAADAVHQARRLGFVRHTTLYYDMEGYLPRQRTRVLRFLSAWTKRVHALGYYSGVYSSSSSGIADLSHQYRRGTYAMPDVIYDAWWNGRADTVDHVLRGKWAGHRRVHQYAGNVTRTFGGVRMNIDLDFLDVARAEPRPPGQIYRTVATGLRVRSAPRTSATIITVLGVYGSKVTVTCYTSGTSILGDRIWYHIVAPATGYVAGYYLSTGRDPNPSIRRCP